MRDHIQDIKDNYRNREKELMTQLFYGVHHNGTAGSNREEVWEDFFRSIVPKKFNIARSVFVIDSEGNVSKEVDIAIYDEQYTPYIFNYGRIKFIPIEAVAAVIQCKSVSLEKKNLEDWVEAIKSLNTSADSVARIASKVHIGALSDSDKQHSLVQTATRPIRILCHISEDKRKTQDSCGRENFDIVMESFKNSEDDKEAGNLSIKFHDSIQNFFQILCTYNRVGQENHTCFSSDVRAELNKRKLEDLIVKNHDEEYTLLSFIFQFNQMLMIINNPMFFPHMSYVKMFNAE